MTLRRHIWIVALLVVAASLVLGACASGPSLQPAVDSEGLFWGANYDFMQGRYEEAREKLRLFVTQYPDNPVVPEARLGIARTYFEEENYGQARVEYERFLTLHPRNERMDEALYFIGLSYFQQMEKVGRDQTATTRAVAAFRRLLTEAPRTPYRRDAQARIAFARRRLAAQEVYVGLYYLKRDKYKAAIGRFQRCLDQYPGTGLEPKALFHLGEAYTGLEENGEGNQNQKENQKAEEAYQQVVEKYPDSVWAPEAADRLGIQLVVHEPSEDNTYPDESGGGLGDFFDEAWDEIKDAFRNTLSSPTVQ